MVGRCGEQAVKGFPEALGAGSVITVNKFFENSLIRVLVLASDVF